MSSVGACPRFEVLSKPHEAVVWSICGADDF